jgi:hypothetical protein
LRDMPKDEMAHFGWPEEHTSPFLSSTTTSNTHARK